MLLHGGVRAVQERPTASHHGQYSFFLHILHLLSSLSPRLECSGTHRVAALGSDVWQKRNRSSLSPLPKAYLLAILKLV